MSVGGFVLVGTTAQVPIGSAERFVIADRHVAVFHTRKGWYCLDAHCYHAGGPLEQGIITDIELLGNARPCVTCPWHQYQILLDSGEGAYVAIDPTKRPFTRTTKSKGNKQRTHEVKVEGENIFVKLTADDGSLPSDYYSSDRFRKTMLGGVTVEVTPAE
eukprot:c16195_g1_i1.p1 GENE.c16195_g1_i1~~c16195_g1_i1.p1  ORF type:complete len:160 (+),score=31.91 c16195_g1_i1:47-526(+)